MSKSRTLVASLAVVATGTIAAVTIQQSVSATVSSGDRPILIQITPCRLVDTRPSAAIGPQVGKVGPQETVTFDAGDATTECAGQIPSDAVGLSTNVTALGATELSFLTFWPSGAQPDASSLNPAPGEPPTPNGVATGVDNGSFNVFNNAGETHLLIDINGYYVNHDHNDLYSAPTPVTAGTFSVGAAGFDSVQSAFGWNKNLNNGVSNGGAWITSGPVGVTPGLAAPVQLPHGATVTSVTGYFTDESDITSLSLQLRCAELDGGTTIVATGDSTANPLSGQDSLSITTSNALVDNSTCSYFFIAESGSWVSEGKSLQIFGASITTS